MIERIKRGGVLWKRSLTKVKSEFRKVFPPAVPRKSECALITNNCLAGYLYHDWKMQFLSPTINLQMDNDTFIRFCASLPGSLDWDFEEVKIQDQNFYRRFHRENDPFPVGRFQGGEVYFQHYRSFEEAVQCWDRRAERLKAWMSEGNEINIVLTSDRIDDREYSEFMKLPYENKLILLRSEPTQRPNTMVMEHMKLTDYWFSYQHGFTIQRFYEQADFAGWVK